MKGVSHVSVWGRRDPDRTASAQVLRWEYTCARETTKDASVTGTEWVGEKAREVGSYDI